MANLSDDDIIIAVIGPPGVGKSTFIQVASGSIGIAIGDTSLGPCTTEIKAIKCYNPARSPLEIVFVDTPGFDDTNKTDFEILTMIAGWLKTTYKREIHLAGILYLHRISDDRMTATPLKNLRMFEMLCGKEALQRVILATSMWDDVDEETGQRREEDLRTNYWKPFLDRGSARFDGTAESALKIVRSLTDELDRLNMVAMRRQLLQTQAGRTLLSTMEFLVQRKDSMLETIRAESKDQDNNAVVDALDKEYKYIQQQLAKTLLEFQASEISLAKRFIRGFMVLLGMRK